MKIVCFHVLNDYSGSPKVLEMVFLACCLKATLLIWLLLKVMAR